MIAILLAAQLTIVAHAADTVGACEPLEVSVAVAAPAGALPQLVAPVFGPFDVMRSSSVPQVQRDSRAVPSLIVEYRYVLVADHAGSFTIAPFEARQGPNVVRSAPIHVTVTPTSSDETPTVITRARIDTGDRIDLRASAPDTVYVGQQANYTVAVFLNSAVRNRMRRNPTFYPPDMQAMLAYDVPGAGGQQHPPGMSSCFETLVYRRALFPLQTGRLVIPPAELTYTLPVGASFFSREESHDLRTDSAVVIAVDPPATGRPPDFDGAVGRFHVAEQLQSTTGRVGDPLTLTIKVSGTGNVKLLPAPRVTVPWASVVPSDQRVQVDSTGPAIGGSKEFDWILTPRIAGELDVPPIRYAYFDPSVRRYAVATTDASRVHVTRGALASVDTTHNEALLALRPAYGGPVHAPLSSQPVFWVLMAIVPVPALGARWRGRRRWRRHRNLPADARMAEAAQRADSTGDGRLVRRTYAVLLAERLGLDSEELSTPGALRRALRRAGVTDATADDAERLLRDLDAAAFAPDATPPTDGGRSAVELVRRIDAEALPRHELPFRGALLTLLLMVAAAGAVHALRAGDPVEDAFTSGVAAYHEHDFAGARHDFAAAVTLEPRAVDAWVNLGTAAWAMHDTVDAVVGWRRGLGLDPTAGDARSRLGLVHGLDLLSPGYVPPVPADALILLMAVAWLALWASWHPALRNRFVWVARWSTPMALAAAVSGLGVLGLNGRLSAHKTGVVRSDLELRADPAFGADQGAGAVTGEIVRVLNQTGAWLRVELDGGRQGWVPDQSIVPLDAPQPPSFD